ncbi:MAG: acid phosphatase [Porphyrobacter sp.]|nr:acid phosphatase [Porphyrobacter sp.]
MRLAIVLGAVALALGAPAAAEQAAPAMGRAPAPPAGQSNDAAVAAERIKPFQYLYGSGEAGAISIQAYHALIYFVRAWAAQRPEDSVVLAQGATLASPSFVPCGDKPLAAVFDVDETMIQNLGFEARAATGEPYSGDRWTRWEATGAHAVAPIPGAVTAVNELRKLGVTVIFNTNRDADQAEGTAAAIAAAGLGQAVHGQTLFLKGDDAMGSGKDGRRWAIAAKYCVIAMAGDQLGDFSDLFNAKGLSVPDRRQAATHGWAARLWGNGWFVLPNPVYGPALSGGIDDIFPADKRWPDAGAGQ